MRNKFQHRPITHSNVTHHVRTVLLTVLLLTPLLNGCVGFLAGAATGAVVAHDERPASTMLEDETIEVKAKEALYHDPKLDKKIHINVTSYNHVVLLTGEILSHELRDYAVDIVSKVENVKRIYNEVIVADLSTFASRSNDTWITTKVKTDMLGAKGFDSSRVKVVTERGTVYLMGIVSTQQGNRAAEIARKIDGVKQVVKMFQYVSTIT